MRLVFLAVLWIHESSEEYCRVYKLSNGRGRGSSRDASVVVSSVHTQVAVVQLVEDRSFPCNSQETGRGGLIQHSPTAPEAGLPKRYPAFHQRRAAWQNHWWMLRGEGGAGGEYVFRGHCPSSASQICGGGGGALLGECCRPWRRESSWGGGGLLAPRVQP